MPSCTCTNSGHSHSGTCKGDGHSLSAEHNNEWLCKECYDAWVAAKFAVIEFQKNLMTIAINNPDKLKQAQQALVKVLGASA